jgi:hypothetical protein
MNIQKLQLDAAAGLTIGGLLCACGGAPPQPVTPPAAPDRSLWLDGTTASMAVSFPDPDPFTTEATVSAWVRADVLPSKAGHIFHIAGKSGFARDLDLQIETDDHFHFYVATGAPHTAVSKTVVQVGTWYRVDATYRANDVIVLYVNRAPEASVPIAGVTRQPNTGPITVGENATFHGRFFQGLIDEVSLRARALSAAEVATARSPKGPEAGLIAAYSFDGDTRDVSGAGHDGQLVGAARLEAPGAPEK